MVASRCWWKHGHEMAGFWGQISDAGGAAIVVWFPAFGVSRPKPRWARRWRCDRGPLA